MSMKKCPQCLNMDIPVEQEICFYCGYQFTVTPKVSSTAETNKVVVDDIKITDVTSEQIEEIETLITQDQKTENTIPVEIKEETPWSQSEVIKNQGKPKKKSRVGFILAIIVLIVFMGSFVRSCNDGARPALSTANTDIGTTSQDDQASIDSDGQDSQSIDYEELSYETAECEHCGKTYYSGREWIPVSDDSNIVWNEDGSTPIEFYNPNEHCYELFVSDCTWEEAQAKCEKMGGHLVTITCYEEFDRIISQLNELDGIYPEDGHPYQIWLGFYYEEGSDGQMHAYSVNGDLGLMSNWAHHANGVTEPTFTDPNTGEVEDKFSMYYNPAVSVNPKYGWVWNTLNNDVSQYHSGRIAFICEWEHCTVEENYSEVVDTSGYVLSNSSDVLLSYSDVSHLTQAECRIARNEIYARHGRRFSDEQLQSYFDSCSWYSGTIEPDDFDDAYITDVERKNLDLLVQYETDMGWR